MRAGVEKVLDRSAQITAEAVICTHDVNHITLAQFAFC